jgi:predicted helicase
MLLRAQGERWGVGFIAAWYYREKYAFNLKREFPRIPFYPDFNQWVKWGEQLLKLPIGSENVKPFKLTRVETPLNPNGTFKRAEGTHPKPKLKSDGGPSTSSGGNIQINEDTRLTGIPPKA